MAERARILADDAERRVVAHRADRLLRILDHRRQDQLHILHGHPGGDLAAAQLGRVKGGRGFVGIGSGQRLELGKVRDQRSIILSAGDAVLDLPVVIEPRFTQIDRDQLSRAERALFHHIRLGDRHHPSFRPYEEADCRS